MSFGLTPYLQVCMWSNSNRSLIVFKDSVRRVFIFRFRNILFSGITFLFITILDTVGEAHAKHI